MLVPGNLGFHCVLFVLGLVAFLVIRHKWRNAVAKKEEIMRLVAMASEETAIAEVQATVQYSSVPVVRSYKCAVCFSPTTRRCSQCKAVRYCSGKCQIIHWRQGHKDECYYSTISMMLDEGSNFGEKAELQQQSEIDDMDFGMEKMSEISFEALSMTNTEDIDKNSHFKETRSTFAPSGFTPTGVGSKSSNVSSKEVLTSVTLDQSEKDNFCDTVPGRRNLKVSGGEMGRTTSPCSDSTHRVHHVGMVTCASKSTKKKSGSSDEGFDFQSQISIGKNAISDDVQKVNVENKKQTMEAGFSEKVDIDASKLRSSPSTGVSCSGSDKAEDTSPLFNSKEAKYLSFHAFREYRPVTVGVMPNANSVVGYHSLPSKSGGNASIPQNVTNGLKSTVCKAVEQLRVSSKSSRHGHGNEVTGKYNCKLIFPYELFVDLYHYDKVDLCPFGLTNCGNSCYANAVLQCLAFTRPLTSYLLQGIHSKACRKKEWCFICEFECLILKGREGSSPLSPVRILSKIHKFGSHLGYGKQEDAHEFLRYAIDTMQSVCLKEAGPLGPSADETTLVGLTFGGHLLSKIKCLKCLSKSEICERMMDLTVEIDGDIETLEEALAQFTASEILERDNKYRCSRCKSYEKARKKLTVLEAPNILTIVLKRFQSSNFEKLNKWVKFSENLDMAPYMSGASDVSPLYGLYGVVVHLDMNAALSGHYVCYIRNFQHEWFKIDDSTVEPVSLERVLSQGAYMLLYARHSPQAPTVVRSNLQSHNGKSKRRNLEAVPSSITPRSKSKCHSVVPKVDTSMVHGKPGKDQYFEPDVWSFANSVQRVHAIDSSSESSSIFSSSDGSSCSTASTKDSVATEDLSDYIFGETGPGWYTNYSISSNSIASSSYRNYDVNLKVEGERNLSILYSNNSRHRRRLTNHFESSYSSSNRSSGREADFDQFVYANPYESRSGVSFRTSGDVSAQTFF